MEKKSRHSLDERGMLRHIRDGLEMLIVLQYQGEASFEVWLIVTGGYAPEERRLHVRCDEISVERKWMSLYGGNEVTGHGTFSRSHYADNFRDKYRQPTCQSSLDSAQSIAQSNLSAALSYQLL